MRIPAPVSLGLVVALGIVSTVLWSQLHTERQLASGLRKQLSDANAALAAKPRAQPVVAALPQPAAEVPAAACPAPTEKMTLAAANAIVLADSAKRQKAMLEDAGLRKARVAQMRSTLQLRFANLIKDLGLSEKESDGLFTIIAEGQLREEELLTDRMSSGTAPDAAAVAEINRVQQEQQQQQKNAIVALLGPERAAEYQEYEHTAPSRQRVTNLTNMYTQSGKPLTSAQSKSLNTLFVAEQRRQESEAKALMAEGQSPQQLLALRKAQAESAIEGDRRVLAGAASFLDAQQIELMRARFEQAAARTRASANLQQRAIEAAIQQGEGN
jgi:hypothetical protein